MKKTNKRLLVAGGILCAIGVLFWELVLHPVVKIM